MKELKDVRPFGLSDKLGYLFGDFGNDFTFILSSSFLLKFYTDVMGVEAYIVGMIMMAARFVDAFTDVAMGRICDRSRVTTVGKFKPWIRRMCAPVAIASFLIYQSSLAGMPMTFKIIYLFVTYILWGSIFYTSINIPYGSMASAVSEDPGDRQSLSTYRTVGGSLAGMIIGVLVPLLAYDKVGENTVLNGERFTVVAGVFSVIAVVCYLLCYWLTTERVQFDDNETALKNNSVVRMFKNAFTNRALISIIAASVLMLLAQLTMQSMSNYVYPNFYKNAEAQSFSTITMVAAIFVAAAIAKPLSKKYGKAEISAAASFFATVISVVILILRPQNVWVYVALQTLCWFGLGVFSVVTWALITDVIDYSEIRNGIREDGSVYAIYSFARKLGQAASAGLSGVMLSVIGYTQDTAFDTDVVNGIFNIATIVPAVGFFFLALVLWLWYPLNKRQVDKNVAILKEKHEKKQ